MPIQLYNLDIFDCWGEDDSSFINELEFYSSSSSPTAQDTIMMGGTSGLLIPGTNIWKKVDNYDDEIFLSMSPPNPLVFDEFPIDDEWETDELMVSPSSSRRSSVSDYDRSGVINHDCMWAGHCSDSEHESRTFSRLSCNSTFSSESANTNNYAINSNISSSNRTGPTIHQPQNSNCSSSNNNNNSSNSCSVVQTIEVPSVCGPIRRTEVIVQKTVGRSLLIKSRTKSENNLINNSGNDNNNTTACNRNSIDLVNTKTNNVINNSYFNSSFSVSTPPVTNSRPETPQSLPESEDDSCEFDFSSEISSVFSNIDNIKPPQGALWDDVLAAVEQEQADGIEIPPINSSCSNINNRLMDELLEDSDTQSSKSSVVSALCSNKITVTDFGESISVSPVLKNSSLSTVGIKTENSTSITTNNTTSTTNGHSIVVAATTVVSDHSYDKRPWSHYEQLGIQTPSDSEEEIDVVSLEKSRTASRSSSASSNSGSTALPTKPSAKDQEKIQVITTSKLLSASRAVSRRLKTKVSGRSKQLHHHGKRRRSESEEFKTTKINKKPRVYYKPVKSRFATDSESDSKEKRDMHNNMERLRRVDLRNSFEHLRGLIPSLANKERAPKVVILQDAACYCTDLQIHGRQLASQVAALTKVQERLRATLSGLRRSFAANR